MLITRPAPDHGLKTSSVFPYGFGLMLETIRGSAVILQNQYSFIYPYPTEWGRYIMFFHHVVIKIREFTTGRLPDIKPP
jgi:hypothetical protein